MNTSTLSRSSGVTRTHHRSCAFPKVRGRAGLGPGTESEGPSGQRRSRDPEEPLGCRASPQHGLQPDCSRGACAVHSLLCKLDPRHCPVDEEGSREPPSPDSSSLACRPTSPSSPTRVITTEAVKDPLDSLGAHGTQEIICPGVPAGPREPGHEPAGGPTAASTAAASWGPTPHLYLELRQTQPSQARGPAPRERSSRQQDGLPAPDPAQASLTRAMRLPCGPSRATQTASPRP